MPIDPMTASMLAQGAMSLIAEEQNKIKAKEADYQLKQSAVKQGQFNAINNYNTLVGSGYPVKGVDGKAFFQFGGKLKMLYTGGQTTEPYEVEKGEVVQGNDVRLEAGTKTSSDTHNVNGKKHSEGGVEGSGGERVFSDFLSGSKELWMLLDAHKIKYKDGDTYGKIASKLGEEKGKYEKLLKSSHDKRAINSAKLMISRFDELLDAAYVDQEASKFKTEKDKVMKYGGKIKRLALGGPLEEEEITFYKDDGTDRFDSVRNELNSSTSITPTTKSPTKNINPTLIATGANLLNTALSLSTVNKMKTEVDRNQIPVTTIPNVDMSRPITALNNEMVGRGVRQIKSSSAQGYNSAVGSLISKGMSANTEAEYKDMLRQLEVAKMNNATANEISIRNTMLDTTQDQTQRELVNNQIENRQRAVNTGIAGIMGNLQVSEQRKLDARKMLYEVMKDGNRNTLVNSLNDLKTKDPELYSELEKSGELSEVFKYLNTLKESENTQQPVEKKLGGNIRKVNYGK